jgi:hypothetical protein
MSGKVDAAKVTDDNVGDERLFVGVQVAGDRFEAVTAAQLAHQMPDAGRWAPGLNLQS